MCWSPAVHLKGKDFHLKNELFTVFSISKSVCRCMSTQSTLSKQNTFASKRNLLPAVCLLLCNDHRKPLPMESWVLNVTTEQGTLEEMLPCIMLLMCWCLAARNFYTGWNPSRWQNSHWLQQAGQDFIHEGQALANIWTNKKSIHKMVPRSKRN